VLIRLSSSQSKHTSNISVWNNLSKFKVHKRIYHTRKHLGSCVCDKLTIFYNNVLFFRSTYGNFDFDFFCKLAKKNFKTMIFSCNLSCYELICIISPKSLDQSAPLLGPAVAASLLPPCTYLTLPFTCDVAHEAFKPLSLFGNFLHDSLRQITDQTIWKQPDKRTKPDFFYLSNLATSNFITTHGKHTVAFPGRPLPGLGFCL
jgi:hypothetical protein